MAGALTVLVLPVFADSRFGIRRMERNDVPPGKAQCDIRLQVDDQVEVTVDRDQVFIRTLAGQDARDDGSECNVPLPGREVAGFNFEVKDSRNEIQLVEGPTRRNNGRVVVRIRDSSGGFGRYHFRLSWAMDGVGGPPPVVDRRNERRDDDRHPPDTRDGAYGRGDLRIVSASWGAPRRSRDVTRVLQDHMRDGRLRIRASNEDMGFDPAYNVVKTLVVVYEIRGRRQEARVVEGDYLQLP